MPKRGKNNLPEEKQEAVEPKLPVDLNFLPEEYIRRINDIFDSYLGLGMKVSNMQIEDDYSPSFPSKMSSLSSPDLGDKLGEYTAWYSFTADKTKYIAVALNFIEEELREALDKELGTMVKDRGNIEAKKSAAKSSTDYMVIQEYAQKLRGVKIMLDQELSNYDKCISTLSREVSRRENTGGF